MMLPRYAVDSQMGEMQSIKQQGSLQNCQLLFILGIHLYMEMLEMFFSPCFFLPSGWKGF